MAGPKHPLRSLIPALVTVAVVGLFGPRAAGQEARGDHQVFEVRLDPTLQPAAGRVLILVQPAPAGRFPLPFLRVGPAPGSGSAVAAQDIKLAPGESVIVDADLVAYPTPFSRLKPGEYFVQAVIDADPNHAFSSLPSPGDVASEPVRMQLPSDRPKLTLTRVEDRWPDPLSDQPPGPLSPEALARLGPDYDPAPNMAQRRARFDAQQPTRARTRRLVIESRLLTTFSGQPTHIQAYVLTPPGYEAGSERYPTVFVTQGFGALFDLTFGTSVRRTYEDMAAGRTPHMIWVFLDHATANGTHEFADSANNGPWGKALTEEFIPLLDKTYRTEGARTRFTTGHSSGGWAVLWLQVRYPKLFAGAWATAPDPVDFRNFTNVDIYAPNANAYVRPDGTPTPLVRNRGQVSVTLKQHAQFERVIGDHGGQMDSFDWVFSPKGPDGRPKPLYDRVTGAIDPSVAAHWRENYDIAHRIRTNWRALKPDLDGKLHVVVGTADTYHLDGAVHLLQTTLDGLGAKSDFRYFVGRGHGDLTIEGIDAFGLDKAIAWEMYAVARPGIKRPPYAPVRDSVIDLGQGAPPVVIQTR